MSETATDVETGVVAPVFRVVLSGGELVEDRLPVEQLNTLSLNLQKALQAIAEQVARAEEVPYGAVAIRRAHGLAVTSVRPGSAVVSYDFVAQKVPEEIDATRAKSTSELLEGVSELAEHSYLPRSWDPRALKSLRALVRLADHFDTFILESPRYRRDTAAQLQPELAATLRRMVRPQL